MVRIKGVISIRLDDELRDWIGLYVEGKDMSKKVNNLISSHLTQKKYVEERINLLKAEISNLENALKTNIFSDLYDMTKEETEFVADSKKIIQKNISFLGGQLIRFNKLFDKNFSIREFKYLLEQF